MVPLPKLGEASSQNQSSHCLLCYANLQTMKLVKTLNHGEILTDIFHVFCKYMRWEPGTKFKYNFRTDPFPFCQDCKIVLIQIYKLHEDIQGIQKQIEQFVLSASARILVSEVQRAGSPADHRRSRIDSRQKENCGDSKSVYYRGVVLKYYTARIQLTSQDCENVKQFVGKSADLDIFCTKDQDLDVIHSVNNTGPLQEPAEAHSHSEGSQGDTSHDEVGGAVDDDLQHSEYSGNTSSNGCHTNDDDTDSTAINCKKKKRRALRSLPKYDSDKPPKKEKPSPSQADARRALQGRIKELGDGKSILDDKLEFQWTGHLWKCLSCSATRLARPWMMYHLKSKKCPGLKSPESVKVLDHLGFKYDKLMDDVFECRRCPYKSKSSAEIKNHVKEVHVEPPRQRDNYKLARRASFTHKGSYVFLVNNEHRVTLKNGKYSCEICAFTSAAKNPIILHVLRKHGRQTLHFIKKIGGNKYSLGDFSFERLVDKFKCGTCDFEHTNLSHIKGHIRHEHIKDISKYVCETCGYSTLNKVSFDRHLKIHRNERSYLCDICGKSFNTHGSERSHRLTMHESRSILCDQCGMKFSSQCTLKAHMKSHNTLKCHICGKSYTETYLRNHLQSHKNAGKKLFECSDCGKKFKAKKYLDIHGKSCSGDRPYSCDICGMKFTQIYNVTRHKKVAHDPNKTTKTMARKQPKLRREPKPSA